MRESDCQYLQRESQKVDGLRSAQIGLTPRYGFDTNVAFTNAFQNIYVLTAINPGILTKLRYVRRRPYALADQSEGIIVINVGDRLRVW